VSNLVGSQLREEGLLQLNASGSSSLSWPAPSVIGFQQSASAARFLKSSQRQHLAAGA
jgi:hypothetical protein